MITDKWEVGLKGSSRLPLTQDVTRRRDGAQVRRCIMLVGTTGATWQIQTALFVITTWYHNINTPLITLPCRACISNTAHAYSWVCCFLYRPFHSKLTSVAKQLACIWPYSFPALGPLIWMPALFFFLLLFCGHTRRLFLDGENEAEDPVAQRRTQLAVLRWVQLVGVRGSSIHTGLNWAEWRTTVEGGGRGGGTEVCYNGAQYHWVCDVSSSL